MPRKKKTPGTVIAVTPARRDVARRIGSQLVQVDAIFNVPSVHPSGSGPWADEADKIAWTDPATGFPCIIRRSQRWGHLCGYVGVELGHPLHGFDVKALAGIDLRVHGGIDYAEPCAARDPEPVSVCHVTRLKEGYFVPASSEILRNDVAREIAARDDAWWLGFSCDKESDALPKADRTRTTEFLGTQTRVYRDEAYVHAECTRLAAQLKAIETGTILPPAPAVLPISDRREDEA
jgi:hypothetical protein